MPPENLREQIGRLRALAPELNAVTGKAHTLILAVEHLLGEELKFALSAHAVMASEQQPSGEEDETWLEYTRIDGKFRICITEAYSNPYESRSISSRTVWDSCTREQKLESVAYIRPLLEAVAKKVERTITEGHKAAESVDQYLQIMEDSK